MKNSSTQRGFTLVELMVVIVIIAGLASLAFAMSMRSINKSQKIKALQQMRDLGQGMEAYIVEHNGPPIPASGPPAEDDTVYGPGQQYGNEEIVMTLFGGTEDELRLSRVSTQFAEELNPKGTQYIAFPLVDDNREGMGEDGKLYDPWGTEFFVAINADPPSSPPAQRTLDTKGLGEWTDGKPCFEAYATWTYGKDKEKGESLAQSDDVARW